MHGRPVVVSGAGASGDGELVRRVLRGDGEAARLLYGKHVDAVWRFVSARCGDRQAAEEIVQDTFLDAWHNLAHFDGRQPLWPWLRGIARRKLARHGRHEAAGRRDRARLAAGDQGRLLEALADPATTPFGRRHIQSALKRLRGQEPE